MSRSPFPAPKVPAGGPLAPLPNPFLDIRGAIQTLAEGDIASVQVITSKAGSVRANHFHRADWHYNYLVSGKMRYVYRPAGSKEPPQSLTVTAGQMVFTPPLVEHAVEYLEDSMFINITGGPRDQASYENDLVRVELIKPKS